MHDEIQKLKEFLNNNNGDEPNFECASKPDFGYAVGRFCKSYHLKDQLSPDDVVLLRQCLRWSGLIDIRINRPVFNSDQLEILLKKSDMDWSSSGYLSAKPYAPKWLEEKAPIIDKTPKKCFVDEGYLGEPYLNDLGYKKWRSQAQKEGAWMTITSAPGSTKTIVLPTGYGKSICFQLLPLFSNGLTVVVVPTVALAIDQYYSAMDILKDYSDINPCFFSSNDTSDEIVHKLKNRESRLIFASPETCVSGKLRPILNKFAVEGWLENLVVDEAHLIETWGALFRVEFQILAACRKDWLKKSNNNLRTFLFSATMAPKCRETLKEMFFDSGQKEEGLICQRLRPEIQYYGRWFKRSEERWPYICEAIWHLPRPLILYVTTREEAGDFYNAIKNEGFQRIGCFTGKTSGSERERLLSEWRENQIDLMVATSAFGVGVDKSDVRAVIHACYPENLDRYYQAVVMDIVQFAYSCRPQKIKK